MRYWRHAMWAAALKTNNIATDLVELAARQLSDQINSPVR